MNGHTSNDPHHATLTDFSKLLEALNAVEEQFVITLPADWLQGRTAYGGLSAALCLEATLRACPGLPPLRSAQFAFIGPATGELHITPKVLRQGRSAVFTSVDLVGEAGLAVRATFCFGAGRDLPHDYHRYAMPATPDQASCPSYFASWSPQPDFMSHFEGRQVAGGAPLAGSGAPEMLVWLRHRDPAATGTLVSLMALADALPPASFAMFTEGVPISTMTWAVDILDARPESQTGWWLVRSEAETLHAGYSAQTAVIWHPDGRPVMAARQNVAIFGKR
jgi:acyl-CoA thioesterase